MCLCDSLNTRQTFIMPSKYNSIDSLPIPKDSNVKLIEVPDHKVEY